MFGKTIRVAAVQAAPVFLDKSASTEKACSLIIEAGAAGATVIGFPEGFIPSHPAWMELLPGMGDVALSLYKRLFRNAVEVPGKEVAALRAACRQAGVYAVVGINERLPSSTGTLFNTQIFIGPDGELLHKHQKYVPTVGERMVHGPGQTGYRASIKTPIGGLSGLICGENSNPLAQYAISLDYPVVHVAAWPQHFDASMNMQDCILNASRGLAYSLKTFVANCVARIDDDAIAAYGLSDADAAFLHKARARGGTSIIGPRGDIVAGPLGDIEAVLYSDVSTDDLLIPKSVHDFAGHYQRPDVFAPLFREVP